MIRADLHIHTTFSDDSETSPKALVEQLATHPSIKVAAVTDHDTVKGINTVRELASPYPDILIIPGVEISTPQGDIVILGTEETPAKPWTIENVIDYARENACVSVAAHPFREWGLGDLTRTSNVDTIEVLNGASTPQANRQARELAKTMRLPGVAGSDSHTPSELYSVYTEIDASLDVDEILKAIKKGSVTVSQTEKSIHF
ncbi:MAG TPA: CehA/McbA family metallohydrolase [Candidatus Bathyarchaeia archaeon]|nr:CehA/McbA family metallohydrolase [Candidatus Bathyarchaeia archaeon]